MRAEVDFRGNFVFVAECSFIGEKRFWHYAKHRLQFIVFKYLSFSISGIRKLFEL